MSMHSHSGAAGGAPAGSPLARPGPELLAFDGLALLGFGFRVGTGAGPASGAARAGSAGGGGATAGGGAVYWRLRRAVCETQIGSAAAGAAAAGGRSWLVPGAAGAGSGWTIHNLAGLSADGPAVRGRPM